MRSKVSLYDIIGYQEYSPFSEKSKKRISGELGEILRELSNKLGDFICDLGCGGGIWSFYLESLGKKIIGIDEDKTMIQIAKEYKNFYKKSSKFILRDIFSFNEFPKVDSFLILDNLISIISKENLRKLFEQIIPKTKKYIILECYNRVPKEGDIKYSLNGNDILESVTKKSDFVFKRNFLNLNTNQSVTFDSYKWEKDILINELKKLVKIEDIIEIKGSFVFVLTPNNQKID